VGREEQDPATGVGRIGWLVSSVVESAEHRMLVVTPGGIVREEWTARSRRRGVDGEE
jgi:hypothetical protein